MGSDRESGAEYERAICPGCGVALKGSREPGDRDYCQEEEREVTLAPGNRNVNASTVLPSEGGATFGVSHETVRAAIEAHREGDRVPVDMHPNDRIHGVVP